MTLRGEGYFAFLKELAASPAFRSAIWLTDEQEERQKHLEYGLLRQPLLTELNVCMAALGRLQSQTIATDQNGLEGKPSAP